MRKNLESDGGHVTRTYLRSSTNTCKIDISASSWNFRIFERHRTVTHTKQGTNP